MNINFKKLIIGGLLVGVIIWVVGMVFGNLAADLYKMSPKVFWKPMGSKWMTQMVIYDFVAAFLLAFAYSVFEPSIPGSGYQKGLTFGLIIFLVGPFLGLTMTYITMAIRAKLILMWVLNNLVNYLLAGLTFQMIDERIK